MLLKHTLLSTKRKMVAVIFFSFMLIPSFAKGASVEPGCFHAIARNFFETQVVMQALQYYKVPQSSWTVIARDLQKQNFRVYQAFRRQEPALWQKGADPSLVVQDAKKILEAAGREAFRETVTKYTLPWPVQWDNVFRYIVDVQWEKMNLCIPRASSRGS